jgi:hypothetical protein
MRHHQILLVIPPGNFIGLIDDHNYRWIIDKGNNGPDKGHGGKYLILPPGYNETVPSGYNVGKSQTWKATVAIRSVPADGNKSKALEAFDNIKIYPLSDASKPSTFQFVDVTNQTVHNKLLDWEGNLEYWKQLKRVIDAETSPVEFRPMYGMLQSLGIEKGKPFNPDARMTAILQKAIDIAQAELKVNSFASREPERLAWNDRNWEWTPLREFNNTTKDLGLASFLDLQAMDNWFYQAFGATPSIGKREPGGGSLYYLGLRDNTSAYLDGGKTYRLNVPGPVPGKLFWSVTVYDVGTRVAILQRWDGSRPKANPLYYHFYIYMADRKLKEFNNMQKNHTESRYIFRGNTIAWMEKLLETPIDDYRKNAVNLILAPYLINIKKLPYDDALNIINNWLSKCDELRQLDQNFDYTVRYALKYSAKNGNRPLKLDTLKIKNLMLYNMVK